MQRFFPAGARSNNRAQALKAASAAAKSQGLRRYKGQAKCAFVQERRQRQARWGQLPSSRQLLS